jgi:hypothetical protein
MGEWEYSSAILYLGTTCNRVVSFTTEPLYPGVQSLQYLMDKKMYETEGREETVDRRNV